MRESIIEKHLVKRAKEAGGEVRKLRWIGRRGAPDRVMMLPSAVTKSNYFLNHPESTVWVELKATKKKPEAHQLREHKRMRKVGQTVLVFDSIEAIDQWFDER